MNNNKLVELKVAQLEEHLRMVKEKSKALLLEEGRLITKIDRLKKSINSEKEGSSSGESASPNFNDFARKFSN